MRKLRILIVILMTSCIGISQTLQPKLQHIQGEKHYCFTMKQSKEIAGLLEFGKYNDSLVIALSHQVGKFQQLLAQKDQIIAFQSEQLDNYASVVQHNDQSIGLLEKEIRQRNKKLRRGQWYKVLLSISLMALGVVVIIK